MNKESIDLWLIANNSKFDNNDTDNVRKLLQSIDDKTAIEIQRKLKNPTHSLLFSIFTGSIGLDRFYIGDIGLGIAKLLTVGGFYLWWIIDIFLIKGDTRKNNIKLLRQYVVSSKKISTTDTTNQTNICPDLVEQKMLLLKGKYKSSLRCFLSFSVICLFSILGLIQCTKEEDKHYHEGLAAYEAELATWNADSAEFNAKISYFDHLYEVAENENDTAKMYQYIDSLCAYYPPSMSPALGEYSFGYVIILVVYGIILPTAVIALIFLVLTMIRYLKYKKCK